MRLLKQWPKQVFPPVIEFLNEFRESRGMIFVWYLVAYKPYLSLKPESMHGVPDPAESQLLCRRREKFGQELLTAR